MKHLSYTILSLFVLLFSACNGAAPVGQAVAVEDSIIVPEEPATPEEPSNEVEEMHALLLQSINITPAVEQINAAQTRFNQLMAKEDTALAHSYADMLIAFIDDNKGKLEELGVDASPVRESLEEALAELLKAESEDGTEAPSEDGDEKAVSGEKK